jgi:geranylgeranyl diphosphate synthase type II
MQTAARIEGALEQAVALASASGAPPLLASALRYAVFPAGHRIRPQLCLAVAQACGDPNPSATDAAAVAIELLHCASLVHDDLPCMDNADFRRGKTSVHLEYGESLAVLTGDALIVQAFTTLAGAAQQNPAQIASLIGIVARAVGSPHGIVAGQAWECEVAVPLSEYQRAKTGALFVAATMAGAAAAGHDPEPWCALGEKLGEAYQVADDLRDVLCDSAELGKPNGQDAVRLRPNAAAQLGVEGAKTHLEALVAAAVASVPDCPGASELRKLIAAQTAMFFPKQLARVAA